MDLRKGSEVKEGKRRCIRCRGRKKLYKTNGAWSFENSGGTLTDCILCLGTGLIDLPDDGVEFVCGGDLVPISKETRLRLEKEDAKESKKRRTRKAKEASPFEKEY